MAMSFSEDLKKIFLAGIGAVAVTAEKSGELVDELVKKGELTLEQGKVLNEELKRKIKEKTPVNISVNSPASAAVDVQSLKDAVGKMTRQDLEEIKAKISAIEASDPAAPQNDPE